MIRIPALCPSVLLATATLLCAEGKWEMVAIPALDPKGDVYKTEGPNDLLIYDDAIGTKKMILVFCDFADAPMEVDTRDHGRKCLGGDVYEQLFASQSYGKLDFEIEQVHGWRRLPGESKDYNPDTTDTHREMFVQVFKLYPEVDFRKYDYICAVMPRVGNTAFGEREDLAIPYRDTKIKVAMNLTAASPYVLAHEVAHMMGLPDLYTYKGVDGPKNPVDGWDLMSVSSTATGFLGWHRHKLGWLDADRKTYVTRDALGVRLTPLHAKAGVSMAVIPADDPAKPSKVFVVEEAQARRFKGEQFVHKGGLLVYSVDAKITTGHNPVVVYPKEDLNHAAFQPGDSFDHADAPFTMKVLGKADDGSYLLDIRLKAPKTIKAP